MALTIFWAALATVAYVYVGYPALVFVLARLHPRPVRKRPGYTPAVSFVIAAYNEEAVIAQKLDNTLALDYPADLLEIIVVSDGSTDRTDEIVRGPYGGRARLLQLGGRQGKTLGQNRAAEAASGDVLVFSDATTMYRPESLLALTANFADPDVGLATGDVVYGLETGAAADRGRAAYWNYESLLRRQESLFHSVLGSAGCVYALRRRLYTPLPAEMISDVVQTVKVVQQGYRAVVEDDAIVYEPAESRGIREELERRARVIARGLRGKWYLRDFFHPLRHPWFCWQVLSHRILRWAVPVFLMVAFVANLALLDRPAYRVLFAAQVAFYATAVLGYVLERRRLRVPGITIPLYFCLVNLAPLLALRSLLRGERKVTWETGRP
jgi:cellulose synthase/poly-beta-1,6-N-acetylglucosamine synthase-like glycosyltransferase